MQGLEYAPTRRLLLGSDDRRSLRIRGFGVEDFFLAFALALPRDALDRRLGRDSSLESCDNGLDVLGLAIVRTLLDGT